MNISDILVCWFLVIFFLLVTIRGIKVLCDDKKKKD